MEILNGIDQENLGTGGDCTDIDGATIDDSVIGGTIPAAGTFTSATLTNKNTDALILGGATTEGGDVTVYRDTLGNKQLAIDADAANNTKALDVYGGIVAQNHLTVGNSVLQTDTKFNCTGSARITGALYCGNKIEGGIGNEPLVVHNIYIEGTDAIDHNICFRIDGNDILCAKATGNGSGGITENSKEVIVTGQLNGNLINNQMVQKAIFDILGLMTDPRCLYAQMEDPGAGTLYDASGNAMNGTYHGEMTTGDRVSKGMGWALDFDSIDDYVNIGDSDSFSFGNGTNDECVTWLGVVEVVDTGTTKTIIAKYDNTSGTRIREWKITIGADEKITISLVDESVDIIISRATDNVISDGYHVLAITYDGAGGATAADTIKIYIDGVLVSSTAVNNESYVAMENTAESCLIGVSVGSSGAVANFMVGDIAFLGIDGSEWSAYDVHRFYQLCKGLYGI